MGCRFLSGFSTNCLSSNAFLKPFCKRSPFSIIPSPIVDRGLNTYEDNCACFSASSPACTAVLQIHADHARCGPTREENGLVFQSTLFDRVQRQQKTRSCARRAGSTKISLSEYQRVVQQQMGMRGFGNNKNLVCFCKLLYSFQRIRISYAHLSGQ